MKMQAWRCAFASLLVGLSLGVWACRPTQPVPPATASSAALNSAKGGVSESDAPAASALVLEDPVLASFFEDDIPRASGGYTYGYGGKTRAKVLSSDTPGNRNVFGAFFDDDVNSLIGVDGIDETVIYMGCVGWPAKDGDQ